MIIYHQNNVAAFAGSQIFYWPTQLLFGHRVSVTTVTVAAIGDIFTATANIKQLSSASPTIVQLKLSSPVIKQLVTETVER